MNERLHSVQLLKLYEKLVRLCSELDTEMDGVVCPASAAAILNAIRFTLADIDDESMDYREWLKHEVSGLAESTTNCKCEGVEDGLRREP